MSVKFFAPQMVWIRDLLDPCHGDNGIDDNYIKLLKRTVDEMRSDDPIGRKISNADSGWQSIDGCDDHPAFLRLMRCIKESFYEEVWPFWGLDKNKGHMIDMHNSWANINDKGAWNKPHKHNGCWMSGAFYINAQGDEGDFIAMSQTDRVMGDFPHSQRMNENENLRPKTGMLYMFPSGMTHMVEPNKTDNERYSISFNLGFHFKGERPTGDIPNWRWDETLFDVTEDGKLIQVSTSEQ